MDEARRIWHRVRCGRDEIAEVAGNMTSDSGGSTRCILAVGNTMAGSGMTQDRGGQLTAKKLWLDAYKKLEEEKGTKKMVKAYEALLSSQLDGSTVQPGVGANNNFSGCRTPEEKISGMLSVTEATIKKASRHSERKQGFVKAAKVMSTISSAVVKPMLQTEAVASLAWAGVCVALEFSIRAATAGLDMVDGLSHVAKRMEWYMLLHTLLLEGHRPTTSVEEIQRAELHDRLASSIQELYYNLLLYGIQCVCYWYRESRITKTWRALVTLDDWKGRLNDIKELESHIQMDMSQFAHIQAKDQLDGIAQQADEKFENIDRALQHLVEAQEQTFSIQQIRYFQSPVGLLSTSDYNKQMRLNPNRVTGTCEWFCNHETFKEWLSADTGLLLVSADPGCGKSTLARYLIEEVLPQLDIASKVVYFFFKDTNEQRRLDTALCAVLHQILLEDNALVNNLQRDIVQTGVKVTENTTILWKMFSEACKNFTSSIICVFDALDECDPEDFPELIRNIKDMVEWRLGLKFLITTRGYPRILNQVKRDESGLIHLDGDGKQEKDEIQREISLVLDYKLDELSRIKGLDQQPERKVAIEKAFRAKGSQQRSYLWMRLVFDIMERIPWKSDNDWKKLIISPPHDVNDAYATLLQNVPEDEKDYVKILLQLMVAAYRPLTLREMSIAMMVRDSPGANDEKCLGLQPENEFKDWVIQTCGFFVTIYDNQLYFIHQTAKEFLVSHGPGISWPRWLDWFSPVTEEVAHKAMAESSIAYLSLRCFNSTQFQERARTFSPVKHVSPDEDCSQHDHRLYTDYELLNYTTSFWAQHFKMCQSFDGTNFKDVGAVFIPHYLALFATDAFCPPGWIFLGLRKRSRDVSDIKVDLIKRYSTLDAALWFDHGRLLVHSLHHNACIHESLLRTAAGLDAVSCVQFVATTGVDINAQDESGATALCAAASHGATEAANMLLDYNADVNLSAGPDKSPLSYIIEHYARAPGFPELLRRVVRCGADVNNTRVNYFGRDGITTPLAWATEIPMYTSGPLDNSNRIQRLDDWIQGKVPASGFHDTVNLLQLLDLSTAEEFLDAYNHSLIKLLLDHGANINRAIVGAMSEGRPMTALEHACFRVSVGMTSHVFWNAAFLLHSGADSSLNTETGNSALDWLLRAWVGDIDDRLWLLDSRDCQLRWDALAVLLLNHNTASAYINKPISNRAMQTRLHSITEFGTYRRAKVKLLLDHGAEANFRDLYGKTPIHYLISHTTDYHQLELHEVLEMLIAHGADIEARDSFGKTPIHYCRSAHVFRMLLKHGADLESRDLQGNTPLQSLLASSSQPDPEALKYLIIEMGASQATVNIRGETLGHTAASMGLVTGFKYICTGDSNFENVDFEGKTPLKAALDYGSLAMAALLLKRGADPGPLLKDDFDLEQPDGRTGATLLTFLSKMHAYDFVKILLHHGANPNPPAYEFMGYAMITDMGGVQHGTSEELQPQNSGSFRTSLWERADSHCGQEMPLHLAMRKKWTSDAENTVNLLLKYGANIEAKSSQHKTPLQLACSCENEEGALFLLKMGADVNATTLWGESALSTACMAWLVRPRFIRDLLDHGATINTAHHNGYELLCRIAGNWRNSPKDESGTRHDDASSQDSSNLGDHTQCFCQHCCREHERKACAAAQILLASGALIGVCNPQEDKSSLSRIARNAGWLDLAELLEQTDMPDQ